MNTSSQLIAELIKQSQKTYNEAERQEMDAYPHIFLLGAIMDKQISYERAFEVPKKIAELEFNNNFNFLNFESQTLEWYVSVFKKYKLHRFNEKEAEVFFEAIQKIKSDYDRNANNVWNDTPSSAELVYRLLQFYGVGLKIATMVANILSRKYKIPLKDFYSVDISADVHVRRVFYRLGLIDDEKSVDRTIYRARDINPEFPGLLDLFCWKLGEEGICSSSKCGGTKCPMNNLCPKHGLNP